MNKNSDSISSRTKKNWKFVFTVLHLSVWNYGKSYLGNDVDVDDGKVPISFGSESPQY